MDIQQTALSGVYILKPSCFGDSRGWFMESYSKKTLENANLQYDFIQDNHSFSAIQGTLRGIHFQMNPKAQAKLVRCVKGRMLDVVVDLRKSSPDYRKWLSVELSAENKKMILIPKGFGHGFLTLTPDVEIEYKVDEYYSPDHDRSIRYDDPDLNITWGCVEPVLSLKDGKAPLLRDSDCNF